MSAIYTSKLRKFQYLIDGESMADLLDRKAHFCVNCCEECAPAEECEACQCDSIFPCEELYNREWFTLADISKVSAQ